MILISDRQMNNEEMVRVGIVPYFLDLKDIEVNKHIAKIL